MGYLRGLRHGAIIGATLGILFAPEAGVDLRRRLSKLLGQAQEAMGVETSAPSGSASAPRRRAAGGTESKARRP